MLSQQHKNYSDLPIIHPSEIRLPVYAAYGELVLNLQGFAHPGTNKLLQPFLTSDLESSFSAQPHSFNAKLMLINLAVARSSPQTGSGDQLFKQAYNSDISIIHDKVLGKLDFNQPLLTQLAKLDQSQKEAFVAVPKFNRSVSFKDGKWSEFYYLDNFWISHFAFQLALALLLYLIFFYCPTSLGLAYRVLLVSIGIVKWSLLEYGFHRFDLHGPFKEGQTINGHYIHHAFPGFKYKLALSWHRMLINQFAIFLIYYYFVGLEAAEGLHISLGLHLAITLYDSLHYYFHFGPELNIPILRQLKRNHMKHHFRDPNRGFGVTNTFWDKVFGTEHII